MTSFSELLSIFALAFVLGALLPFAVRPILHRYNMVDVPNERSSHTAPTYRGMGLATARDLCGVCGGYPVRLDVPFC